MSRIKEKILFPATGDGHEAVKNAKRWHMIDMRNCRNVRISGVTLRDSLCYNIAMWGCEDVDVSNVKIIGQWRFNTDDVLFPIPYDQVQLTDWSNNPGY